MHLYASTHKVHSVARCILTHSHSYAFKRIQMHSLTHAFRESAEGLTQLQDSCMLTRVCIRMHSYAFLCIIMHSDTYGNAYECIIIRMHQNATHVHAPNCAYMHHVQNAYIRQCTWMYHVHQMQHIRKCIKLRMHYRMRYNATCKECNIPRMHMNASCGLNARECNKLRKCNQKRMHFNAHECTWYQMQLYSNIENAHECKQMHQYQNASYMNAYKCNNMQYHAGGDECIYSC